MQLQEDLQTIRVELEASEQQSNTAIEDLKLQLEEKQKQINSQEQSYHQITMDCNDLSELCQKQLQEIERLNLI